MTTNIFQAAEIPQTQLTPADPRRLPDFESLKGRTVTNVITRYFPETVLIVCAGEYLKVVAETGYEGEGVFSFPAAEVSELRDMGFATQADVDLELAASKKAQQGFQRAEYERLKAIFEKEAS